ncbi:MAG: lipopolysaccharide biosynthesis protein [Candidatus Omnitrophota bacterium]
MVDGSIFKKDTEFEDKREDVSFGRLAVRGGVWVVALRVIHRALGLARTIILARLLSPNDFGLMGIAVLAINTIETFSRTGFETALVQKKENIKEYLDTVWTVQLARSVVLFAILYLAAPLIAGFFKSSLALPVIRLLAFLELFTGARNVGTVYFQKELRFDKRFILEFSGLFVNIAVSLTLAFILRNVWALVYGSISGAFVTFIMSYILHPYRPKVSFNTGYAKELLKFGKWLFGSSILVFLVTQGDDAFVGRLLGITALGFYQMAYHLSNAPATEITHVVSQVMFPVYSKIQDNIPKLGEIYLSVLRFIAFLSFPVGVLLFVMAPDFTRLFLGDKWMPMVPAMRVLCVFGLSRSIGSTVGPVLYATNNPKVEIKLGLFQLIVLIILIYPFAKLWGILGVSYAVVASNILNTFLFMRKIRSILMVSLKKILVPLVSVGIPALIMAVPALLILKIWTGITGFFIALLCAAAVYISIVFFIDRRRGGRLKEIISIILRGVKISHE